MANLFFRTNVAPYRIDTYNILHEKLDCEFYFLYKEDASQNFNMQKLYNQCNFKPLFLKTISILSNKQKLSIDIWSILRKESPEVVIVPEFKIIVVQVLIYKYFFFKKFKVVSMCDDSWDMISNNHEWSFAHKMMRKLLTPFLDELLLVDNRVVRWYQKQYRKGIWLPIIRDELNETVRYEKVLPLSIEFLNKFNLNNKKVLLFVGRLCPEKNLERLLDAVSMTKENYTLVIVGNGELEEQLKLKSAKIDKEIIFAGRYEGDYVRAWYNIADCFILPSIMEAYGAVTNEALIAGCYSLISEAAGSSCLINDLNGKTFNPVDVAEIANLIDLSMAKVKKNNKKVNIKDNLMPFSFNEIINNVINKLLS